MKLILMILFLGLFSPENQIDGLYYEANSADPSSFEFNNNELVAKTDSILHFGFQYTSYYKIENINDTIFELHFSKQYIQDNNESRMIRRRKKVKSGRSFWFQIDKFKYWSFRRNDDGVYKLSGYDLVESSFIKKMEKSLVTTKPKLN
jgi:hypothetical protein